MSRNTIKNALAASLSAEESSFKSRLAKAEAVFGGPPKASRPHVVATEIPGRATAADSSASANSRVVRDSFTMPEKDYALIEIVKSRCLGQNLLLNKSEVLRAGLRLSVR